MTHRLSHGLYISAMDMPKTPNAFTVMLAGKIGIELIAEGRYALWVCPDSDEASRFTRRSASKLACLEDSYRVYLPIVIRMASDIVSDAATDSAPACNCYLCIAVKLMSEAIPTMTISFPLGVSVMGSASRQSDTCDFQTSFLP